MKKSNFIFSFLFSVIVLFGAIGVNACKNEPSVNLNVEDNTENTNKNAAYLSVLDVKADFARTTLPLFDNDTVNDFVFTLKGKLSDSVQTENETIIGTYENLTDLKNAQIGIETGIWILTLTAAKDGTVFTGTKEIEIIAGNNSISFEIQWDENALSGEGNLLYTLDFSKAYNKIDVMLVTGELVKYNPTTKEETAIEAYKETPLDFTDYKVTYELTDVPADVYRIKIHLYADTKKKIPINTYPELAIITGGQTSTAAREMTSLSSVCFVYVKGAVIKGAVGSGDSASPVFITDRTVPIGDLYVCDHEVTQSEYEMYCMYGDSDTANRPSSTIGLGAHFPVYFVSWYDALVYCNLRSKAEKLTPVYKMKDSNGELTDDPTKWAGVVSNNLTGEDARYCGPSEDNTDWNNVVCDWSANGYRLPTDAEWEYIARGGNGLTGTQYTYAGSNTVDDVAWHYGNSSDGNNSRMTHEIKGKNPGTLGLYDLSGNVWEFCWDWCPETGTESITKMTGSYGISSGNQRIKRGGSYKNDAGSFCNVYNQNPNQPKDRVNHTGFRVVRNASFNPLLVRFDTTSNWPENTVKVDSVVIKQIGKPVAVPDYDGYRYGYTFKGWYTTATPAESDEPFNFNTTITETITLYAVWKSDFVLVEGMTFDSTNVSKLAILYNRELTVNDFYLCDHEVTQKEWQDVMGALPAEIGGHEQGVGDNYPVYYVNWFAGIVFCNKLSIREGLDCAYSIDGKDESYWRDFNYNNEVSNVTTTLCDSVQLDISANGYRLPTEVEWEYAARGGKNLESYKFAGSDDYTNVAWARENADLTTHPVKTDKTEGIDSANSLGLYDMCGNVNEWVWDYYNSSSSAIGTNTPITGATSGSSSMRVKKGGGFDSKTEDDTASIDRHSGSTPTQIKGSASGGIDIGFGFRVARKASAYPYLVKFDTTSNYSTNTNKVTPVIIDGPDKKTTEPSYSVKKNGYALKGWYTSATPAATDEPFDFNSPITESITLYAVWYAPTSVGDVILNDGTIIPYSADLVITDEQKANAIAVIYYIGTDLNSDIYDEATDTWTPTTDTKQRIMGIGLAKTTQKSWCISSATANSLKVIPVIQESKTSGDKNGSDNLQQISDYLKANSLTDDTDDSSKYPAFYFAKNYASQEGTHLLSGSEFENGWYLPSLAELAKLQECGDDIANVVWQKLGVSGIFENDNFMTSSQSSSDVYKCITMTTTTAYYGGGITEVEKTRTTGINVLAVREF